MAIWIDEAVKGDGTPKVKFKLPMYVGKMDNEEVLAWIDALDNFEFEEVQEDKKEKFTKTKLKGISLTQWNYVQGERFKKGKAQINSWDRMVAKVKTQFLPADYSIQTFRKLQNLKPKELDVMAYTEEFHRLSIREGHTKDEVEKVARYLNGFRLNIQDEIGLTTPRSVEECFQLVVKEEKMIKRRQEIQGRDKGSIDKGRGTRQTYEEKEDANKKKTKWLIKEVVLEVSKEDLVKVEDQAHF